MSSKSTVQHPGAEPPEVDWRAIEQTRSDRNLGGEPLHLLWAARWEQDKNSTDLLDVLRSLRDLDVLFKLSVIGEQFRSVPPEFDAIQSEFVDRIERWGFQTDRKSYWAALCDADVFISTAQHEFFGLAAAEAIAAGLCPMLPARLACPELLAIGGEQLKSSVAYGQTAIELASAVERLHRHREQFASRASGAVFREQLSWSRRAKEMDRAICGLRESS